MRSNPRLVGMVLTRTSMLLPAILRDAARLGAYSFGDVEPGHDLQRATSIHELDHSPREDHGRAQHRGKEVAPRRRHLLKIAGKSIDVRVSTIPPAAGSSAS